MLHLGIVQEEGLVNFDFGGLVSQNKIQGLVGAIFAFFQAQNQVFPRRIDSIFELYQFELSHLGCPLLIVELHDFLGRLWWRLFNVTVRNTGVAEGVKLILIFVVSDAWL